MSKPSGRFSRYPAVNRDVAPHGATYAERMAGATPADATSKPAHKVQAVALPEVDAMTVREVLDWVGSDAARREAVVQAESAGRGRKGILDALAG